MIKNSDGIWMLEGEQLWDSEVLNVALKHINPGDTVVDAGAWIGGHAMSYAKKVGEKGTVWAYEPNPEAYECLWRNLQGFPAIITLQHALGDKDSIVPFSAKKGWYDSGYVGSDQQIAKVRMRKLDYDEPVANFIKIDVEGYELKVLKGASETIRMYRPKMVIEINKLALERQGDTKEQVFDWLYRNNYTYKPIEEVLPGQFSHTIYNILAMP